MKNYFEDGKEYKLVEAFSVAPCRMCAFGTISGYCFRPCLLGMGFLEVSNPTKTPDNSEFLKTAYASLCKMQTEKDKRYGNSALHPLDIFAKHHPYGSRIDEKLSRVKNCTELRKNDLADIMGGIMLLCKDKGWDNFDDLID